MEKFTLGQVIDGLMNGQFIKAKAEVVKGGPKELVLHEGKIYCATFPGGEVETDIFVPEWNDSATQWDVEYNPNHKPLELITVRYWKSHGAVSTPEIVDYTEKSWVEVHRELIDKNGFNGYLSAVGYIGKQVIIFKGEVKTDE